MWGSKFSCNPRYLYEYIDKNHPDYTCIWSLKDECIPITEMVLESEDYLGSIYIIWQEQNTL